MNITERICGLLIIILLSACSSHKKISYIQDVEYGYSMPINQVEEATITLGDWLSIIVSSKDSELIQMFNLPIVNNSLGINTSNANRVSGYLVDERGYIDYPQLGKIKVEGLKINQLSEYIKRNIIDHGYVNDPVVTTQFMSFKVSVIGEVTRPGTISSPTGRLSLLEALSMAGDLTIYGKRENVKIIRERNGVRTIASIDIRSQDIFNSPYYYLLQNDVIYVEPNKTKAGQREINQNRTVGTFVSVISLLASLSVLIFK
ncbi:MAG: polysaccharide biosynthesis/export family protein [Bacteroidales bacterium]